MAIQIISDNSSDSLRIDSASKAARVTQYDSAGVEIVPASDATLAGVLTTSAFQARINTLGQKTMAASTPVVIASDQASIPVTVSDGSGPLTVDGTVAISGTVTVDGSGTTQPISAASLPLPTGAATEATLAGVLTTSAFQARINTLGQKTMANSTPVVIASDQSAIPASQSGTWTVQPGNTANTTPWLVAEARATSVSTANVTASASSVTLAAANASRRGLIIWNDSVSAMLYVKFGATASLTSFSVALSPGMGYEFPMPLYVGIVDGIWSAAVGTARVTEST